tara:strand:+ start:425 stop:736 length:312 start_codon:yes stop_codon:yes gene_type:complete
MPYTQEELQKLDFYQNLINEDEQQYLQRRALLQDIANVSGSADDGSLVLRNEEGTVMIFENPYTNELYETGPDSTLIIDLLVDTLKNDSITVNKIFDRNFTEL